jgi:hypothetical protein
MFSWLKKKKFGTLICMRQADTWCWPPHLGKKTEGTCEQCNSPIYFEEQNGNLPLRKVCNVCVNGGVEI